jgi:O-antigen biosynthesis protein
MGILARRSLIKGYTRRGNVYNLALKGYRILINEGWRETLKQFRKKFSHDPHRWKKGVVPSSNPLIKRPMDTTITNKSSVSIVIPTKNAGTEFHKVLERIRSQEGVSGTEIIVLDSGSSDNTIEIAKRFNCRIFPIAPEFFHHGLTRNFGVEQATGDFVLFLVQDAMPIGKDWLYSILETFRNHPEIVSVTGRQVPRSDADLFASYTIWNYYHEMKFFGDRITRVDRHLFDELSSSDRRKLAGIDDVCTCFKKEVFSRFKFGTVEFAEDLDLGIRLLKNGYSLAFLYSVAVTHSHNRDAQYFFQRYYVGTKTFIAMNSESPVLDEFDLDKVLHSMDIMYAMLHQFIKDVNVEYPENINVHLFFGELKKYLCSVITINTHIKPKTRLEQLIDQLVTNAKPVHDDTRLFTKGFSHLLDSFSSYVETIGNTQSTRELSDCAYKLFSVYYGSYLGMIYSHNTDKTAMHSIDNLLKRGI